eukprot:9340631-Alexandrium_andersonii.AAC.1
MAIHPSSFSSMWRELSRESTGWSEAHSTWTCLTCGCPLRRSSSGLYGGLAHSSGVRKCWFSSVFQTLCIQHTCRRSMPCCPMCA